MKGNWKYSVIKGVCLLLLIVGMIFSSKNTCFGQTVPFIEISIVGGDQVICLGNSVPLIACTIPGYTLEWTSTDPGFMPSNNYSITVSPTTFTAYTVTATPIGDCINPNGGSCVTTATVNIIVIEGVNLMVEDGLVQCMEGRELTFTAQGLAYIPTWYNNDVEIIFYFDDDNGAL